MKPIECTDYFKSYGDLSIHRAMLKDSVRNNAYFEAVNGCRQNIQGKVVLDVGAGTGILSVFCAQAGARKVYAVEASETLIPLMKNVIKDNHCEDIIEVVYGEIENVEIPEKIDVLISEWMGHYLLHEGMLDSIISARRLMHSDSIMIPEKANMFIALCDAPDVARDWSIVHGVNLFSVTLEYRLEAALFPNLIQITEKDIMSDQKKFTSIDLTSVTTEETKQYTMKTVFVCNKTGLVEGLCIWWEVFLYGNVVLSTAPGAPSTHWKQTVILLPTPIEVTTQMPICIEFKLTKIYERQYEISLETFDPVGEKHDVPCECYFDTCRLTKAYFHEASVGDFQSEIKSLQEENNKDC